MSKRIVKIYDRLRREYDPESARGLYLWPSTTYPSGFRRLDVLERKKIPHFGSLWGRKGSKIGYLSHYFDRLRYARVQRLLEFAYVAKLGRVLCGVTESKFANYIIKFERNFYSKLNYIHSRSLSIQFGIHAITYKQFRILNLLIRCSYVHCLYKYYAFFILFDSNLLWYVLFLYNSCIRSNKASKGKNTTRKVSS